MKKYIVFALITTFLIISPSCLSAQDPSNPPLDIEIKLVNPTKEINDGIAKIIVKNGQPPYQYKWSNQSTSLDSSNARGLIEGYPYTVTVTDAHKQSQTIEFEVPIESITEVFNSTMQPAVDVLGGILFWDPFASTGLYDATIYISESDIELPTNVTNVDDDYIIQKWYVQDGEFIEKGQKIVDIQKPDNSVFSVFSKHFGTFKKLYEEGDVVSRKPDTGKFKVKPLGQIHFDEEQPLRHPNGDIRSNTIPFIVIWLALGSIFFTLRLKFVNLRGFRHAIDLARGKYDDPSAPGTITHFQAMATAVSATVGLGNIAGVAVAISLGGAGATFWMFVAGFFGMSLKFAECTLGVKYRFIDEGGRIFGGPMNYLRYGLAKKNMKGLGKFLATLFAIVCVGASIGGGNMLQSNQSFKILSEQIPALQGHGFTFGVVFALLVGAVIIGGIKSIAKVTEKVVPIMAMFYVIACLVVIGIHIEYLGEAFLTIFHGAFSADALKGGFIGVLIIGVQRAAFSNEAGVGSAAIAHSASKVNHPVADGFASLVEPVIDTMLICTMTALVLVFSGMHEASEGMGGVELTAQAFGSVVSWFPMMLAVAVFLFAFSTMVSWSYYGMRSWTFLFGKSKRIEMIYKVLYLVFVVVGASVSLGAVLSFADMMILAMAFPNIIGLYILSPEIYTDMKIYWQKLKENKLYINPRFVKSKGNG